jgi:hypothetical protein
MKTFVWPGARAVDPMVAARPHTDADSLIRIAAARRSAARRSATMPSRRRSPTRSLQPTACSTTTSPLPLDARVYARDTTHADWIVETVSFAAAYGGERPASRAGTRAGLTERCSWRRGGSTTVRHHRCNASRTSAAAQPSPRRRVTKSCPGREAATILSWPDVACHQRTRFWRVRAPGGSDGRDRADDGVEDALDGRCSGMQALISHSSATQRGTAG